MTTCWFQKGGTILPGQLPWGDDQLIWWFSRACTPTGASTAPVIITPFCTKLGVTHLGELLVEIAVAVPLDYAFEQL